MGKGKSHWEWDMSRQGLSWKAKLKYAIDQVIKESEDFEDFLRKCADFGVLVEYNPDHKIDLKYIQCGNWHTYGTRKCVYSYMCEEI